MPDIYEIYLWVRETATLKGVERMMYHDELKENMGG